MSRKRRKQTSRLHMAAAHIAHVGMNQTVTEDKANSLMLELWNAFDAIKSGQGQLQHLVYLVGSMNTARVLAEQIDPEVVEVVQAARDAMTDCAAAKDKHGRFGFTGQGMQAVAEALEVYGQIVRLQTPRAILKAAEEGKRRVLASA